MLLVGGLKVTRATFQVNSVHLASEFCDNGRTIPILIHQPDFLPDPFSKDSVLMENPPNGFCLSRTATPGQENG
ncbi:hypothetical protein SAMN05444166_2486 [Singulisphaera sp. GP187]|nr:hypothetical protein SAMN05444166_2486 [Singulisphaera sp. GP187]